MPQQFHILRCYNCEKFQVHQTKKATKWQCKVCGEKQSLKKAYFIGSARDCRLNVQQLNFKDGEQKQNLMLEQVYECSEHFEESFVVNQNHVDESNGSSELSQSFQDASAPHEHHIPPKRARYEPAPSFETSSENQSVLSSIFLENDKTNPVLYQSKCSSDTSSHEDNISFDVTFDVSLSNKTSDIEVRNSGTGDLKRKSHHFADVDIQLPTKKQATTKNRGFQLILNAAKKLT